MNVLNLKITWNILSVIFVSLVLASCGGAVDKYSSTSSTPTAAPITKPQPPYVPPTTSIAAVVAACVAEPMRDTVYYYCDCGTGAEASCVAGNDSNTGTSANTPRRTLANAVSKFSTLGINDTVALCKGGAFDSTGGLNIGSNRCGAGVACNALREYTPTTFTGTAKPIINNAAGNATLFNFDGNGGIRLLNLKLKGVISSSGNGNHGFFFYQGAHDVTMCNLDMDTFDIAVYNESSAGNTKNIILTGSHITNTSSIGYLGSGDNTEVSYNAWDGNGSSNVFDHTLYFASSTDITNIQVIGNYIHGQYGPTCKGAVMEGHMAVDGLLVKDNVIDIDPSANTGGCWGIEFANTTGGTFPEHYRNTIYSSNTIINGGNTGLTVTSCPGCIIENNLVQIETPVGGIGIGVAAAPVRSGIADDLNTANVIRNNTIWYGPNANTSGTGIQVSVEGTAHIIANNTVTYSATSTGNNGPFNCYKYPLTLSSYAFINNNHCQSSAAYNWEASRGDLASWQAAASAYGFDTASFTGNPLFTAAGTNFKPASGSPLIGVGSAANGSLTDFYGTTRPNPSAIGAFEP